MINPDIIIFSLMLVTSFNLARYFSSLRSLIYQMREVTPQVYHQVDAGNFFSTQAPMNKRMKLLVYLLDQQYSDLPNPAFVKKCRQVRHHLFVSSGLFVATIAIVFMI